MSDPISKAYAGAGTVFSIGTTGTTPTYTTVAELKTLSQSGAKNDLEDITNFDSAGRFREKLATLADSGEYSIAGNYVGGDAGQLAFNASFNAGTRLPYKIQLPKSPTQTTTGDLFSFLAYVSEVNTNVSFDKSISFAAKLAITGPITITPGT